MDRVSRTKVDNLFMTSFLNYLDDPFYAPIMIAFPYVEITPSGPQLWKPNPEFHTGTATPVARIDAMTTTPGMSVSSIAIPVIILARANGVYYEIEYKRQQRC